MCRVLPLSPNPLGQEDGSLRQADLVRQEDGACLHGRRTPQEQTVAPTVGPQSTEVVTRLGVTVGDIVKSGESQESRRNWDIVESA